MASVYLLKKYSQEIILELIIDEILKSNKNSIILLRRHPKDINDKRSHVLKVFSKLKLKKKNVFFTNLHPQILSRISSRVLCYARTNVMTDVFESKKSSIVLPVLERGTVGGPDSYVIFLLAHISMNDWNDVNLGKNP